MPNLPQNWLDDFSIKAEIDYHDTKPKPLIVQIPLVEYFERIKRLHVRNWQRDFLTRLQSAAEQRHSQKTWAEIHAEGQIGKTVCFQVFMSWLFGHNPLHRVALAMCNVTRSQTHSQVVLQIMNSPIYKDIFPNKDGWLCDNAQSKAGWMTRARRELNDGQFSLNPAGLQTGLVGSGMDDLIIDDPYKEAQEAFSEQVRFNMTNFWEYTVLSRASQYTNIYAMFHRFASDDFGGFLLDTGKFDYWRYATVCDGDYVHEETGQKFADPLKRQIGEYILPEERPPSFYDQTRKNNRVWLAMNQGRPSAEEGDFFNVSKISVIANPIEAETEWHKCILRGRGWDIAVTPGGGDFSAGVLMGLQPDGSVIVKDMIMEQLNSADRIALQKNTAKDDGADVTVCIPEEIGAAAKDAVFLMKQHLHGFNVVARKVTNALPGSTPKARRAHNFSVAVNAGLVRFIEGEWNKAMLRAMRNFLHSSLDDPIDAGSDIYNHMYEELSKGRVIKQFSSVQSWNNFIFGIAPSSDFPHIRIPKDFTVYAGLKITPEANLPNSGVIVARAAENTGLKDALFIVAEYKEYTADFYQLFAWLDDSLKKYCEHSKAMIWLHKDSESYLPTIRQKLNYPVHVFDEASFAGITEANWYCQQNKLTGLGSLPNILQEAQTWGFNDKGEPNGIGQVWDCLRMATYKFRTRMIGLTDVEKIEQNTPEHFKEPVDDQTKIAAHLYRQRQFMELERNRPKNIGSNISKVFGKR